MITFRVPPSVIITRCSFAVCLHRHHRIFFRIMSDESVGLAKLGTKLTLSGREVSYREGKEIKTRKAVFASDVLVALKPAVNEINRLAQTAGIGDKTGIPPEDIFSIEYEITGEKQEKGNHLQENSDRETDGHKKG